MSSDIQAMVDALGTLVSVESPTADVDAVTRCADVLSDLSGDLLGDRPEVIERGGRPHLHWTWGEPRVLLLGHLDTVWPNGTLDAWPFDVADGRATGPGCFDMKAGIVQGLFAVRTIADRTGVSMLITSDEETGAATSKDLITEVASGLDGVLVLEPSEDGALKIARKGVARFVIGIAGRAAHAGLNPHDGANALVELAHVVSEIERLADAEAGTTVVPTLATAGTTENTVPDTAELTLNVRAWSTAEFERIEGALAALVPAVDGTQVRTALDDWRPPLEQHMSAALFETAKNIAAGLGFELDGVHTGGGSDGNFTAAAGVPTLDGLGPVGGGAHARHEHVLVDAMPARSALVAALVEHLLA